MKILTVFTGGTISCSETNGVLAPNSNNGDYLLDAVRQAGVKAEFVTTQPYTVLSENLGAGYLRQLRGCIETQLTQERFDGVMITHGTDTLPYTAAYLDFVLGGKSIPVVLVSANYPLRDARSNGLANAVAAAAVMRAGVCGVFAAYQNTGDAFVTVHAGSDLLPHLPYEDSLYSMFQTPFGVVQDGVFTKNPVYQNRGRATMAHCELNGSVLFLRPYVGMCFPETLRGVKAVLLESWHSGTLPTAQPAFRAFCTAARRQSVPVYLTGCTDGFAYESKLAFADLGIEVLPPMSPVAAYMQLWLR